MPASLGPPLVAIGLLLVVVGGLAWTGALGWLGRLPGDLRIEGEHTRVYVPLASMLLVSLAVSGIAALVRRFLAR